MARKTKTPKWLSILRKLYLYIGGTTMYTIIEYFNLSHEATKLVVELYGLGAISIQLICDAYFVKDKESTFPVEAKNLRE